MTDNPTITQLHGLDEVDPWDRRTEVQKAHDKTRQHLRETIQQPDQTSSKFIDPPDVMKV